MFSPTIQLEAARMEAEVKEKYGPRKTGDQDGAASGH
jgi:hypothetical protein